MYHRNTRRRPYRPFGYYFVTTNVSQNLALLDSEIYAHLLEHILHLSAKLHHVKVIAYKINPDHVHLICQLGAKGTISQYMGSWKRQFSRQADQLLMYDLVDAPKFKWQASYHSHLITCLRDFNTHVKYIEYQYCHHNLSENKFLFVDSNPVFDYK